MVSWFSGISRSICDAPSVAAAFAVALAGGVKVRWNSGAAVPLNVTDTPWKVVDGNPTDWLVVPKPFPKRLAIEQAALVPLEPKEALLTMALIPNNGSVTGAVGLELMPPMLRTIGASPCAPAGTVKLI